MKGLIPLALALCGAANASFADRRAGLEALAYERADPDADWKPKTKDPHFFQLKVDDKCSSNYSYSARRNVLPRSPNAELLQPGQHNSKRQTGLGSCPLRNYALRLEKGIAIVTPYNQYRDPALPTLFVDDDTQIYTVSKEPLQLYIDGVTGALKYTEVGWLPPNAISTGFFHTGTNPLGKLHPSPSLLTWPSTPGIAFSGDWWLCKIGNTGQWQVFVNSKNFPSQGVIIDTYECSNELLGAVNANPWSNSGSD